MTVADQIKPSTQNALIRGALGRCPRCGEGRLLHRYLEVVDHCGACGETYGHFRADDAAPWLTILIVGHLTVPVILMVEEYVELPLWMALSIYVPTIVLLTLGLLPRSKGVILAQLWLTKAEGSEKL